MQAEEPFLAAQRPIAASSPLRSSRVPLLVAAFAGGLVMFLAIEPTKPWILLVLTALVAVGTDGILREHPHAARERDIAWTAPLLFLPTLIVLGAGLFLEDALSGYLVLPGVLIASIMMAAVLYAQHVSIDGASASYATARFVLNIGTYLTAFALFAVVYAFDVSLVPAALTVGLVSLLLAVEVLREAEADPVRALVFAAAVGLVVAEARWALYFLPLESYLAGVFLLIVFYVASGLVQHHLNDDLHSSVITEFALMGVLGVIIVTLGRVFEAGA
ncbi:MAG TPA: hypothetical protein VJB57_03715 [Dehalococcoidia bacterium]|nr:hypothetical protein [Dehalococcoidia bacterium]